MRFQVRAYSVRNSPQRQSHLNEQYLRFENCLYSASKVNCRCCKTILSFAFRLVFSIHLPDHYATCDRHDQSRSVSDLARNVDSTDGFQLLCSSVLDHHRALGRLSRERCRPVQVECSADQRQMAEGLRRISQLLSTPGNLLREHAQVIREAEHVFKDIDGADQVLSIIDTCTSKSLNEPECAHAKGAFSAPDTYTVSMPDEREGKY